jgi:hypothetical protein
MKMFLQTLQYHRNGIGGNSFWSASVKNIKDCKGLFLITFETGGEGENEAIDHETCRVIMLEGLKNPLYECWRGDNISYDLEQLLTELKKKESVTSLYDLHLIYENRDTGARWVINRTLTA